MTVRILIGDCRERLRDLPDASVHCCVTSPPYFGLRDYGVEGQMGLEPTPDEFVAGMVEVFREVRRVLRDDGTLWLNIGDSYNNRTRTRGSSHQPGLNGIVDGSWAERADAGGIRMSINNGDMKEKDLIGIPWMLAFALRADGWYLRQEIIWHKPNPMPESVQDRCTKAHEQIFLLSKSPRYYFDSEAIAEDAINAGLVKKATGTAAKNANAGFGSDTKLGFTQNDITIGETRNRRSVWTIPSQPFADAHFATYPPALIEPCILAGCPKGGTVLDPFGGAGTTGMVADRLGRNAVLIELNPEYAALAERRLSKDGGMFADVRAA